jgi:hypothetical protein
MSRPRLQISDHALLRWLERSGALDVEALRQSLEGSLQRAADAAAAIEAERFSIVADGLIYLVRDGVLVTVYQDDGLHTHVRAAAHRKGPGSRA